MLQHFNTLQSMYINTCSNTLEYKPVKVAFTAKTESLWDEIEERV